MTSFQYCNIPYTTLVSTIFSYIAVLPPVLNIFRVSCSLETQGRTYQQAAAVLLLQKNKNRGNLMCLLDKFNVHFRQI